MKKLSLFVFISVFGLISGTQAQTFVKKITTKHYCDCFTVKEGCNHYFYLSTIHEALTDDTSFQIIYKVDEHGNLRDSLDLTHIMGMKNYGSFFYIENYQNNMFYAGKLHDSAHNYLYAQIFDTALNVVKEAIIDTMGDSTYILNHLVNSKGNHVFLGGTIHHSNNWWNFTIYETDTNFQLLRKIDPFFSDGNCGFCMMNNVGFVEMKADSSYIITSYKWIIKTDNDFSNIDTLSPNKYMVIYNSYNNTVKLNDSIYFENMFYDYPPLYIKTYTFLNKYNKDGVKKDSIMITTPYDDNRVVQWHDFLNFNNPDTLFYCFLAGYGSGNYIGVTKLSPDGLIYWQKYVSLNGAYTYGSIAATHDGGCVLEWEGAPTTDTSTTIWLIKIDKDGDITGINENKIISDKQILVFPNPANDQINFETGLYKDIDIKIYNINGQLQTETKLRQGSNTIDINKFASGIYFYKIWDKGRFIEDGKFVKE